MKLTVYLVEDHKGRLEWVLRPLTTDEIKAAIKTSNPPWMRR